jgi:hypothetical protein
MATATFIDACLLGEVDLDGIDDFVQQWHESDSKRSLAEHLGMTDEEYAAWVENADALPFILCSRRLDVPLADALKDRSGARLAARARDKSEAAQVSAWLKQTGLV